VTDTAPPLESADESPATAVQSAARDPQPAPTPRFRAPTSLLRFAAEVLFVGMGVFLGLMGDEWRERSQQRQQAESSLRRLRTEIATNRAAVARVKDYHLAKKGDIDRYFGAAIGDRPKIGVEIRGLQNAYFERTAWDLALATGSLAHMDPQIAVALSQIYTLQQDYADLTRGIMQALYLRPPTENADQFLGAISGYFGDIVLWEPRLLQLYDELLPRIDRALGDAAAN
jgi:hypothetical protein